MTTDPSASNDQERVILIITLPIDSVELKNKLERGLAEYATIRGPHRGLDEIKLILEIVGQGLGIAGSLAGIFTFLRSLKKEAIEAAKLVGEEVKPTGIEIFKAGETPVALDDSDDSVLKKLIVGKPS